MHTTLRVNGPGTVIIQTMDDEVPLVRGHRPEVLNAVGETFRLRLRREARAIIGRPDAVNALEAATHRLLGPEAAALRDALDRHGRLAEELTRSFDA
jgi:hypothetical protein